VTLVFFCEFIWCANLKDRLAEGFDAALNRRIERLELAMQLASVGCFSALLIWAWGLNYPSAHADLQAGAVVGLQGQLLKNAPLGVGNHLDAVAARLKLQGHGKTLTGSGG